MGTIMKQSERLTGAREVACLLSNLTLARSSLVSQGAHHSQKQQRNNVAQEISTKLRRA
jgi:hypothetical protein